MAAYVNLSRNFLSDSKVIDKFTPEDKGFFIFLIIGPWMTMAGCCEVSISTLAYFTGYEQKTVINLIERAKNYLNVIDYDFNTNELLILNYGKYNWNKSPKTKVCIDKDIRKVKNKKFKRYLEQLRKNLDDIEEGTVEESLEMPYYDFSDDTVSMGLQRGMDAPCMPRVCVCDSVSVSDSVEVIEVVEKEKKKKEEKKKSDAELVAEDLVGFSPTVISELEDWFQYKKERKDKYTDVGRKKFLTQVRKAIDQHGEQPVIEVIEKTIASGYQGIVWDWLNQKAKGGYVSSVDKAHMEQIAEQQMRDNWLKKRKSMGVDG